LIKVIWSQGLLLRDKKVQTKLPAISSYDMLYKSGSIKSNKGQNADVSRSLELAVLTPGLRRHIGNGKDPESQENHRKLHHEKKSWHHRVRDSFRRDGLLRPFRLLQQDIRNIRRRYILDWTVFNQLIFASAVYVFFTNLLPGITFASDLYVLTGQNWGTIEVVLSTGLCGIIFSLLSIQPLTILGVTGPFSILAENIFSLCTSSFEVGQTRIIRAAAT
jgi:hypothetical protein